MRSTTDKEWDEIQEALVKGGLRETVDRILLTRPEDPEISEANRAMLASAFTNHTARPFTLSTMGHYFVGHYDNMLAVEGVEIDGVLYTIFHVDGHVEVFVGEQLSQMSFGAPYDTVQEAWDVIKRLTT